MEGVWEVGGGLLQPEERFAEKVSGWMNHNVTGGAVLSIHGVYDFVNPKIFQGWINGDSEILVEHHFDQIIVTLPTGLTIETRKQRPLKLSNKMEKGESVFKLVSVHFNGQKVSIERNPKPVQHTEFEVNPFETSSLNIDIKALFVEIE